MSITDQDFLPPGCDAAVEKGCRCPILDNARGKGWMCSGKFVITASCPLHGVSVESGETSDRP